MGPDEGPLVGEASRVVCAVLAVFAVLIAPMQAVRS